MRCPMLPVGVVPQSLPRGSLFLASTSGLLDKECLVVIRPQIVDGRLPIPVGAVCASASPMKNGPPTWPMQQQSGSLLVFADGSLMPVFVANRSTTIGRGVVVFVVVKQPLGGTWGRLQPFKLQPPGRIGEVGRGQMSWRGSTVPHLGRIREGILAHLSEFRRRNVRQNSDKRGHLGSFVRVPT